MRPAHCTFNNSLSYSSAFAVACLLLLICQDATAQQSQPASTSISFYAFLNNFAKASLPLDIHPPVESQGPATLDAHLYPTYFHPIDLGRNADIAPELLLKSRETFEIVTVRVSRESERATYLVTYASTGEPIAALRIGAFIQDAESTYQQWATVEHDLTINQQAMYRFVDTGGEELACTITTERHKIESNGLITRIQEEQVTDCSM